jgi:hypothetical protein
VNALPRLSKKRVAWNKGLTKETGTRVSKYTSSMADTKRLQGESGEVVPWNKGLTKEINESVAKNSLGVKLTRKQRFQEGIIKTWNKGLTKETDPRVKKNAESLLRSYVEGRVTSKSYKTYKRGYREDLGHYVRSSWEANYARLLKFLGTEYEYEKHRFVLNKSDGEVTTYLPDFYLPELTRFIEIKGYWRIGNKEKIELFRKCFPEIELFVIELAEYTRILSKFSKLVENWE